MKCRLTKELEIHVPSAWPALLEVCVERGKSTFAPVGTVMDHTDAWRLVDMFVAEPADEECAAKCVKTDEQIAAGKHAAARLSAGIHPDDFARYDLGEIVGYNADGSDKPGPNWVAPDDDEEEDE